MGADAPLAQITSLEPAAQLQFVTEAIKQRVAALGNADIETVTSISNAELVGDSLGGMIETLREKREHFKCVGRSYLLVHAVQSTGEDSPLFTSYSNYLAQGGTATMKVHHRDLDRPAGRIATRHDTILQSFRYGYHLGGAVGEGLSYPALILELFGRYAKERDAGIVRRVAIEVAPESEEQLLVTFDLQLSAKNERTERFWIDASKGYLIARYERLGRMNRETGRPAYRTRDEVLDSMQVAGVWLPRHTRYYAIDSDQPDAVAVYDTEVASANLGTVALADLAVEFEEGTEVHDSIAGTAYFVQAGGQKQYVMTTNDMAPLKQDVSSAPSLWRYALIGANVLLVLGLCALVIRGRRRARMAG